MKPKLQELLECLPDPRRREGKRHSIGTVMMICIMAVVSGCTGYRAIGSFIRSNKDDIIKYLAIEKKRVPGFSTVRRVLISLNTEAFKAILQAWKSDFSQHEQVLRFIHVDGKSSSGTVEHPNESNQDFINTVSFYFDENREVIARQSYYQQRNNEVDVVYNLLRDNFYINLLYTMDALHAQKKCKPDQEAGQPLPDQSQSQPKEVA